MKKDDEGIQTVREVRKRISLEFDNDPDKLVEHYLIEQQQYRARLLKSAAAQQGDAADDAPRRR